MAPAVCSVLPNTQENIKLKGFVSQNHFFFSPSTLMLPITEVLASHFIAWVKAEYFCNLARAPASESCFSPLKNDFLNTFSVRERPPMCGRVDWVALRGFFQGFFSLTCHVGLSLSSLSLLDIEEGRLRSKNIPFIPLINPTYTALE